MTNRLIVAYDINQYPSDLGHIPYSVVIWICNAYMTTFVQEQKQCDQFFVLHAQKLVCPKLAYTKKNDLQGIWRFP